MGRYCPCNKIIVLSLNWTWVCFTHSKASLLTLGCGEVQCLLGFPGGSEVNVSAWNAGGLGSIPGSGTSPGEGNGNPLQYSCLENPMKGGAWWATVHGVAKSQTRLSDFTFTFTVFICWVPNKIACAQNTWILWWLPGNEFFFLIGV